MMKTIVMQAVPLHPMEVYGGADIHPRWMDGMMGSGGCLQEDCDPVGSPRWSRLLEGPVDPWREEPMLEQVC